MYILLEYVACVVLVSAVMAALFAASVIYIIVKQGVRILAQAPYRAAHHTGSLLAHSVVLARRQGSQRLKDWESLIALKTRNPVRRTGLVPQDRAVTALYRST